MHVVEGEIGTGKSSVKCAVKWHVQLLNFNVVETMCDGSGTLLKPIADVLDQIIDLLPSNATDIAYGKQLLHETSNFISAGVNLNNLSMSIGDFIVCFATKTPLLLIVDDMDKATPETKTVLRAIMAQTNSSLRLAILITVNAGFLWKEELGRGFGVVLPLLSRKQIRLLVNKYLGNSNSETIDRIIKHTGCNPLFVATLLKELALSEEGLEYLEKLGPPQKLETFWRKKLSMLDDMSRNLLEAAAVIDKPVELNLLAKISLSTTNKQSSLLKPFMQSLVKEGWVKKNAAGYYVSTAPISNEIVLQIKREKLFKLHQRALAKETDEQKKIIHAAACGDIAVVKSLGLKIGTMLEKAGALTSAKNIFEIVFEVLNNTTEAKQAAIALGRINLTQGDHDSARQYLEPISRSENSRSENSRSENINLNKKALLLLGKMHRVRSELDDAAIKLNKGLQIQIKDSTEDIAKLFCELAEVEYFRGNYENAIKIADNGLGESTIKTSVYVDLLCAKAKSVATLSKYRQALELCQIAIDAALHIGDNCKLAYAKDIRSWVLMLSGNIEDAVVDLKIAVSLYREAGDIPRLRRTLVTLGDYYWLLERWNLVLVYNEEAMRLVTVISNPAKEIEMLIGLGFALITVGRFERAALLITEAIKEAKRLELKTLELTAIIYEGDLLVWQGFVDEGLKRWTIAKEGFELLGQQPEHCAELELEMAEVFLQRKTKGDIKKAKELIISAKKRNSDNKNKNFIFDNLFALVQGQVFFAEGNFEQGMFRLNNLIEKLAKKDLKNIRWQAQLAIGRELIQRGSEILARTRLRDAENLLEQLSDGIEAKYELSFWQDVRRAEVRRLLAVTVPASNITFGKEASLYSIDQIDQIDPEAVNLYKVLEFNKLLSSESDLSRLMESILDSAIELTKAERGVFLTPDNNGLKIKASSDDHGATISNTHHQFSKSIAESVYLDCEPVVTVDASTDDRFNEFLSIHELKVKSVACVPVLHKGKTLGVLYLENRLRRGRFGGKDLRVLSAFSDQVAIAVYHAQLMEDANKRQVQLEVTRLALEDLCTKQKEDLKTKRHKLHIANEQIENIRKQICGEHDYKGMVGSGNVMRRVFEIVERVKNMDFTIAISGQSGVGKDDLAKILHNVSERRKKPFVTISCGSIPETLVESTLFGHVEGAFSGATSNYIGIFATAEGGTLYIDDIGEMTKRVQISLLRVLQEGTFTPLGSNKLIKTQFRLIVSSKVLLDQLVEDGFLREDLFFRLKILNIELPPLKERREDIPLLIRWFIKKETARINKPERSISAEAVGQMIKREWPGNIRQLEQTIRRGLAISNDDEILTSAILLEDDLPQQVTSTMAMPDKKNDKNIIIATLDQCQWNRSKAAKQLGIPRRTFYRRLSKLGIIKPKLV